MNLSNDPRDWQTPIGKADWNKLTITIDADLFTDIEDPAWGDRHVSDEEWKAWYDKIAQPVLPAKAQICDLCEGRGKHVNPSIDAHGIGAEEFAEDPDFMEDYFSGTYDVHCTQCRGRGSILVPDADRCTPQQLEAYGIADESRRPCPIQMAELRAGA